MSVIDKRYEEKRDFIRMQINSPVDIIHENTSSVGLCKDLSATGMKVESKQAYAEGSSLEVRIQERDGNLNPFHARTEVARSEEISEGCYMLGLTIIEIFP